MKMDHLTLRSLGHDAPLLADGRRVPDRREISIRWLSGTFLTGITSSILMGIALFAAVDGRQQLAIPAEAYAAPDIKLHSDVPVERGNRLVKPLPAARPSDRSIVEVATLVHEGEKEIIRRQPFSYVKMYLAANYVSNEDYPNFDPLAVFSSDKIDAIPAAKTGTLYGSNVESDVSLKSLPFPVDNPPFDYATGMSLDEIEENVRSNGSVLTDGNTQVAALYYVDPRRFANDSNEVDLTAGLTARVVEQNMSVSAPETITSQTEEFADDVIPARQKVSISAALMNAGYPKVQAQGLEGYLVSVFGSSELSQGDVLRIGILQKGEQARIIRASVYRGIQHLATVALDDDGRFVAGSEPPFLDAVASAFDTDTPFAPVDGRDLPRVYDGIYRAALSYGMTQDMTALIIRLLASNVDFQAQLKPKDQLEAFFSVTDSSGQATADSELLYVNAMFNGTQLRFYRFQQDDGEIDYFDEDGKSIRQFLLRNPLPNGIFRSGFGMRRHPILGFGRMHTGVDWAAPRGTPIIAAGNGTVEKAGWDSGGYGNQTLIRHANGYVSSYNHQSAIAKGITPGAKVHQGQVIGWVGTTGQSTGPHLHYELIVNGTKVDPLRIRLPGGKSLKGEALAKFEKERERIDALLNNGKPREVASK